MENTIMSWIKVALVATLLGLVPVAHTAMREPSTVAPDSKAELLSESAAKQAVCMYRAKLAYEVVNFRAKGGKRELFQVRFSERVDPDLKARTLAAVDLAFNAQGTAEEVAALIYGHCAGTHI
jgi:hypothetical protein